MTTAVPTAPGPQERVLLAEARAGDERAFRRLVEPYRRALEVHCYRMLGSPHDAEDLVQETLLRAWNGLERFGQRSSARTWLYRIATNACLDELERRPRQAAVAVQPYPDDRMQEAASPLFDPAARYALREGVELALLAAIQLLPGRQRAVLILRDVLGWTAPEVAELLETTVAGVTSALQRARATVDGELADAPRAAGPAQRELLRRYVEAWERADIDALVALLREDADLRMPPQPAARGARAIGAFFAGLGCAGQGIEVIAVRPTWANGRPAVVMHRRLPGGGREPHGVMVLEVRDGRLAGLDAYIDPKLPALFDGA